MEIVNVVLIVLGTIIAIVSYCFKEDDVTEDDTDEKKSVEVISQKDFDSLKEHSETIIDETDSELSRLSCKKINELSEYADQVLEKISMNHREVIFLYDMLNEKDKEVKESLGKLEDVKHEVTKLIVELNEAVEKAPKVDKKEEVKEKAVKLKRGLQAEQLIGDSYGIEKVEMVNGAFREKKADVQKSEEEKKKEALIKELKNKERVANRIRSKFVDKAGNSRTEPTIINSSSLEVKQPKYIEIKPRDTENIIYDNDVVEDIKIEKNEKSNLDDIQELLDEIETKQDSEDNANEDKVTDEKTTGNVRAHMQEEMRNNNDQILKLHSQGLNYVEISKKLDLGVGEVMLVINLYKNKAKI